jgi:RNA polymerase sigma-70 factor, ECF subfamily
MPVDFPAQSSDDDSLLVAAMARGRVDALGALYDHHAGGLLALAERIAGTTAAAEDIVQDVFLETWRRAADYDPSRGSVRAWLTLRTRSRALDFRKSASVSRTVSADWALLDQLEDLRPESSAGPDRTRLRDALLALPEEQRQVLLLGYFEGNSSSEIASLIGLPIGTVKSRVAAALSSLRRVLADRDEARA